MKDHKLSACNNNDFFLFFFYFFGSNIRWLLQRQTNNNMAAATNQNIFVWVLNSISIKLLSDTISRVYTNETTSNKKQNQKRRISHKFQQNKQQYGFNDFLSSFLSFWMKAVEAQKSTTTILHHHHLGVFASFCCILVHSDCDSIQQWLCSAIQMLLLLEFSPSSSSSNNNSSSSFDNLFIELSSIDPTCTLFLIREFPTSSSTLFHHHQAHQNSELFIIDDAGHSLLENGITSKILEIFSKAEKLYD